MRHSPSIVPDAADRDVYLVLDNFGRLGCSWRETDEEGAERATLVGDLLEGQYNSPVRVIAFNTAEGWSRDVSEEIADALAQRYAHEGCEIPAALEDFIDRHRTSAAQLPLPLRRAN